MRRRLEHKLEEDETFERLIDDVVSRRLDPASAASSILEAEVGEQTGPA
jgi:LAO/AO transport system kinase